MGLLFILLCGQKNPAALSISFRVPFYTKNLVSNYADILGKDSENVINADWYLEGVFQVKVVKTTDRVRQTLIKPRPLLFCGV